MRLTRANPNLRPSRLVQDQPLLPCIGLTPVFPSGPQAALSAPCKVRLEEMPFLDRNSIEQSVLRYREQELFYGPITRGQNVPEPRVMRPLQALAAAGISLPARQLVCPWVLEGAPATISLLRWDICSWMGVECRAWPSPMRAATGCARD